MKSEFRINDLTYIPETARISAQKRLNTIQEILTDPWKLNSVSQSYSYYDDHLRQLAKKLRKSKSFVLRSLIEKLLKEPEIAVELYDHSESLPDWFREVIHDFVISVVGRTQLRSNY